MDSTPHPERLIDGRYHCWMYTRGPDQRMTYMNMTDLDARDVTPDAFADTALRPLRRVTPATPEDLNTLRTALMDTERGAARVLLRGICAAAADIHNARGLPRVTLVLTAGRPGSWESGALAHAIVDIPEQHLFDNESFSASDIAHARDIAAMILRWTVTDPDHTYTEVAENIATVTGAIVARIGWTAFNPPGGALASWITAHLRPWLGGGS